MSTLARLTSEDLAYLAKLYTGVFVAYLTASLAMWHWFFAPRFNLVPNIGLIIAMSAVAAAMPLLPLRLQVAALGGFAAGVLVWLIR